MHKLICDIGKRLYDKGYAPGTSGNISCRINDKILLTPSGSCLGDLQTQDIITIDFSGNILDGNLPPTSEKFMHIEIYKKRTDTNCIIHAHPPKATAAAVLGIDINRPLLAEAVVILGNVPLVKYETPSTQKLAEMVAEGFINHEAVLMANHGATVCGKNINDAFHKMETLEFVSEIGIITKLSGRNPEKNPEKKPEKNPEISPEKIPELLKLKK